MGNTLIVTRHAGAVEWLRRNGIEGEVLDHVDNAEQICGKDVVGALPLHLAAEAHTITVIDMPLLPKHIRGTDLNADQMSEYGAMLRVYQVSHIRVDGTKYLADIARARA